MKVLDPHNFTNINTECLRIFFNDIRKIKQLSVEEESALVCLAKAGDKAAADRLICSNLRLIITISKEFSGQPLNDLLQAGAEGLTVALGHFDPSKGVYFHTYAANYIYKYMSEFVSKHGSTVYEPRSSKEKAKRKKDEYEYLLKSDPELYDKLTDVNGIKVDSFEDPLSSSEDAGTLEDVSGNTDSSFDCDRQLHRRERNEETRRLMQALLTPQEAEVMALRFGFDDEEKQVWEIALIEGVGETRVRQIIHSAEMKIQACQQARDLLAA